MGPCPKRQLSSWARWRGSPRRAPPTPCSPRRGAIIGFRRSLPLLGRELGGYLLAIVVLLSLVGPVIAAMPAFGLALRIVVCLYLLYLAAMLWRQSGPPIADAPSDPSACS
jgi:threonine/homoserine/homoserine lactone efflux protein